jgi:hypothetical protein
MHFECERAGAQYSIFGVQATPRLCCHRTPSTARRKTCASPSNRSLEIAPANAPANALKAALVANRGGLDQCMLHVLGDVDVLIQSGGTLSSARQPAPGEECGTILLEQTGVEIHSCRAFTHRFPP